jgi:uncharacterized protein involved in response to NO
MVFGFVAAIIGGFVLTAAQNWTGIPGVKGNRLRLLFFVWLAARVLISFPEVPPALVALVDLAFFPCLAILLAPYLRSPEIDTERFFFLFFALFFAGNLLVHLEVLGWDPFRIEGGTARFGVRLGLDAAVLVTLFMGGRVIPFFTESTLARKQPRTNPWIERLAPASAAVFVVGDLFFRGSRFLAAAAFVAALVHGTRLGLWQVRRTRRVPLIWVLHLGYAWMVAGFALSGFAVFGRIPVSVSTHAFTVGGLGIVIYGMITRVSLGHTGRRLHPTAATVGGYGLLALAAAIRVFGPLVPGFPPRGVWLGAGGAWSLAFLLFVAQYASILARPRADGRPG